MPRPELLGILVDRGIPVLAGVVAIVAARRMRRESRSGPVGTGRESPWMAQTLAVVGPLLLVYGVVSGLAAILVDAGNEAGSRSASWSRHATEDGVASAEFPAPPQKQDVSAPYAHMRRLAVVRSGASYSLTTNELSSEWQGLTAEEKLDFVRDNMPVGSAKKGTRVELVREQRITQDGIAGRRLDYRGEGHTVCIKMFALGERIYQLTAVVPEGRDGGDEGRRFLDSLRLAAAPSPEEQRAKTR
jgi:hypothetical protein